MSRIGRLPIPLDDKVKVACAGGVLEVSGPLGRLSLDVPSPIEVRVDESVRRITVDRPNDQKRNRALHGTVRALALNMVKGVTDGFEKKLQIVGVGYSARVQGEKLVLNVGYSLPVEVEIPEDLSVNCPGPTEIEIKGIDKQRVGQFAAEIRRVRPPEPYKGKGIRYVDEHVRRKQGKAFVSGG